ncbi:NADPH-dependent oxidoreductase [Cupriavidus sp. PET2-C1]
MSKLLKLLATRYGEKKVDGVSNTPAVEALNPVLETILAHRSVRAFLPETLPAGTLELLIGAAQSAPSSSNLQTWSVIAIGDEGRRRRLSALAGNQAQVREAPLVLAWLADLSRLRGIADHRDEQAEGLRYLDTFLMAVIDAALAAQNVVTAAESLGLGTVYIGALRNQPEAVARELNTGTSVFPVFGLCIGFPDLARPAAVKPRLSQRTVLYREQYTPASAREEVAAYDEVMKAFYGSQQLPPDAWSAHSVARLRGPDSLKGRDRLREALAGQGFELL